MDAWSLQPAKNDRGHAMRDLAAHEARSQMAGQTIRFTARPPPAVADMPPARTDARRRILDTIEKAPGIHKSALCKEVDLAWGTVCYHVDFLVETGFVATMTTGRELHLFPAATSPERMRWVTALRSDMARSIIDFLGSRREATIPDFRDLTGASRKVIYRQLSKLQEAGLVVNKGTRRPRFALDYATWYMIRRDGLVDRLT